MAGEVRRPLRRRPPPDTPAATSTERDGRLRILLDVGHDPALSDSSLDALADNSWGLFAELLRDQGYDVRVHEGRFDPAALDDIDVLVLIGPRLTLENDEIRGITAFVASGHGLLISHDQYSLFTPGQYSVDRIQTTRQLSRAFGFEFRERFSTELASIARLVPHAVTADLRQLPPLDVCRIEAVGDAKPLAFIRQPETAILVAATAGSGRIVAIASNELLSNLHLTKPDPQTLVRNSIDWLSNRNLIDIGDIGLPGQIPLGQVAYMMFAIRNNGHLQLDDVECTAVWTGAVETIDGPRVIPFIQPGRDGTAAWSIRPRALGRHGGSVQVTVSHDAIRRRYIFQDAAEFACLLPGNLTVSVEDRAGETALSIITETVFQARASVHWSSSVHASSDIRPTLELDPGLRLGGGAAMHTVGTGDTAVTQYTWPVLALEPGYKEIVVHVPESGQSARAAVFVKPSTEHLIKSIRQNMVEAVEAEVVRALREICHQFESPELTRIPFLLLSIDEFAERVHSPADLDRANDIVRIARTATDDSVVVLNEVLRYFGPTYVHGIGACVPFDPDLADRLVSIYPLHRDRIRFQLMGGSGTTEAQYRSALASYLLHEKYGHGFFSTQTTLGQQLAILDTQDWRGEKAGPAYDAPFSRYVRTAYADVIQVLEHSAVTTDEGFAAWLELAVLPKLGPEFMHGLVYRSRFVQEARRLIDLRTSSRYFAVHWPMYDSPYQLGYEQLESVRRAFGPKWGEIVGVEVVLHATELDFGIRADAGTAHFAMPAAAIEERVLDDQNSSAVCELRLMEAARLVREGRDGLLAALAQLDEPARCGDRAGPVKQLLSRAQGGSAWPL